MQIKFKAPDPRAGTTAQMDSSRGQHFIDTGSAVRVKDGDTGAPSERPSGPALFRAELDAALAGLPGENKDPDYVVRAMRSHFGVLFTDVDEAKVREVVKAPAAKPSDGLTVAELKEALEAKQIPIPDGARKQDLVDLLDGAK